MIIYTVITKKDCPIPDQKIYDSRFKYICLHSVDVEKKHPWRYIQINNENNPLYTYNKYKILCPFEESVFVDGKVIIEDIFYTNFNSFGYHDIVVHKNPFVDSFLDEIVDWLLLPAITYEEAINYIRDIKNMGYPFLDGKAPLTDFIYRKNTNDFNRSWWTFWLHFKKRNQLPFFLAEFFTNKKIAHIDNSNTSVPKHQPFPWTDIELRQSNVNKLIHFQRDLKELGIDHYKFSYEQLTFRGIMPITKNNNNKK